MVENRGIDLAIVCGTFCGLAFLAVALRCYVRIRLVKAFGRDDWFTVAAEIAHLWFSSLVLAGVYYGTGRHLSDLTDENAVKAKRIWWLCYIGYCLTMVLVKIAIGLFFLRVTVTKLQIGIVWFTIGHSILAAFIFLFVVIFQCWPVSYYWEMTVPGAEGSCIKPHIFASLGYLYGSASALGDITYGILPLILVWKLDISRGTKFVLAPLLGMAAIASCGPLVRMAYLHQLTKPDFLYSTVDIAIWSTIEPGLAIIASSLATLRPLFRIFLDCFSTGHSAPAVNPNKELDDNPSDADAASDTARRRQLTFSAQIKQAQLTNTFEVWRQNSSPVSSPVSPTFSRPYALTDLESARIDSETILPLKNTEDRTGASVPQQHRLSRMHRPADLDVGFSDASTLGEGVSVPGTPVSPTSSRAPLRVKVSERGGN